MKENAPFEIQIQEDGKQIGTDEGIGIAYSADTISLMPKSFQASNSRHYSIVITPKKSFPGLQVTKPQAQIDVDYRAYMPYVHRALFFEALSALLFLSGLAAMLAGR
ncbi:MAG: hypothetical protein QM758_08780 [Armatimonas sp.]